MFRHEGCSAIKYIYYIHKVWKYNITVAYQT